MANRAKRQEVETATAEIAGRIAEVEARIEVEGEVITISAPGYALEGPLVPVKCDLAGYEGAGLTFWYRVNNRFGLRRMLDEYSAKPTDERSDEEFYKLTALFLRRIDGLPEVNEAGNPLPSITPSEPSTYGWLFDEANDLAVWAVGPGYAQAKANLLGN